MRLEKDVSDSDLYAGIRVTASELLEYLFCPRFIYYMNCLCISQYEGRRFKVLKGRNIHEEKSKSNIQYLRSRLGCIDKQIDIFMESEKLHIKGKVDEVLTLSDGTLAPLDYKYAEFKGKVYSTHRYQSVFYAALIKENFGCDVKRGFICYTRSGNRLEEIPIGPGDFKELQSMIRKIIDISRTGYYPKATPYKGACADCCYRNICTEGLSGESAQLQVRNIPDSAPAPST
jgi:CRISPR-associated exonuclease Cas4